MKENKQAAMVALLGLAATGAVVYATRKWWMPKVKETVSKYHYADEEEETIEIPALNPRMQIADNINIDEQMLEDIEAKVREFFKAVVQKTKGECVMNPLIVCSSSKEQPQVEIPQTEEVEEHLDTVIAEGERIFAHTAQYHGTKLVF